MNSLELTLLASGSIEVNQNVIFDTIVSTDGNIEYDASTGVITLKDAGKYKVDWWVATQSSASSIGAGFSIVTSQGDNIIGNSPIKTGEVVGIGLIQSDTEDVTVEIKNSSNATVFYSPNVSIKATLVIYEVDVTAPPVNAELNIMTTSLGNIDTVVTPTEGSGNNQAIGAIAFGGDLDVRVLYNIEAYVVQVGSGTGQFQMAILESISTTSAEVVAITNVVNSISGGVFTLPLTASISIMGETVYYLAVWNQVNASELGGIDAGLGTVDDAPPINFRIQNLSTGFTLGQIISTSDVSIRKTPWLSACR